jgi:hypothetical protein
MFQLSMFDNHPKFYFEEEVRSSIEYKINFIFYVIPV